MGSTRHLTGMKVPQQALPHISILGLDYKMEEDQPTTRIARLPCNRNQQDKCVQLCIS